jgi:hypothetical protein
LGGVVSAGVESGVPVGSDPLASELSSAYGTSDIYGMHWLQDVDNTYGYGDTPAAARRARAPPAPSYINTFHRGAQESVWETVPQPTCDNFTYGGSNGYFKKIGNCVGASSCAAGTGKDSEHILLSWYYAWGGAISSSAGWAWLRRQVRLHGRQGHGQSPARRHVGQLPGRPRHRRPRDPNGLQPLRRPGLRPQRLDRNHAQRRRDQLLVHLRITAVLLRRRLGLLQGQRLPERGAAPSFTYHRFWAQADIALAMASYGDLFGT